jgi:hypothetical protein
MGTTYRHTQVARTTLVLLGTLWLAMLWWAVRALHPAAMAATVFVGALLILFTTLTVSVGDRAVDVYFGPGLIRRRIPLRRIRDARAVRTPWFYGWGIRLTPGGWLWNVSGMNGVEIRLDDGRQFRIGTDEPDELAEALRQAGPDTSRPQGSSSSFVSDEPVH